MHVAGKNRGGLGRGLDSLLGGSYEESMTPSAAEKPKRTAERERVVVPDEELPAEARVTRASDAVPPSPAPAESAPVEVVAEDGTVIKGVTSRAAKAPVKSTLPPEPERRTAHPVAPAAREEHQEPRDPEEVPIELIEPNPDQPRRQFR